MVIEAIKLNDLKQNKGIIAVKKALVKANLGNAVDTTQMDKFIEAIIASRVQDSYKPDKELSKLNEKAETITQKYYSHVDPTKEITPDKGVVSPISVGKEGISHAFVYIEYLENGVTPTSICTDLTYNSKKKIITINIDNMQNNQIMNQLKDKPFKRSWTVKMTQVKAALKKAKTTQSNTSEYTYVTTGSRPLGYMRRRFIDEKKSINCARYANKILKAAGIDSGLGVGYVKTPYKVATGNNDTGKIVKVSYDTVKRGFKKFFRRKKKKKN